MENLAGRLNSRGGQDRKRASLSGLQVATSAV
jgi:hypothetical protein